MVTLVKSRTANKVEAALVGKLVSQDTLLEVLSCRGSGATFCTIVTETEPTMVQKDRQTKVPNPFFGKVIHVQERNILFGANYANAVNKAREECLTKALAKLGNVLPTSLTESIEHFTDSMVSNLSVEWYNPQPLWNGKGVWINSYICQHIDTGEFYLRYMLRTDPTTGHCLPAMSDGYFLKDTLKEVSKDDLVPYMPVKSKAKASQLTIDDIGFDVQVWPDIPNVVWETLLPLYISQRETFFRTVKLSNVRSMRLDKEVYALKD